MELQQFTPVDKKKKEFGSWFCVGSWVRYETHQGGRKTHQPKHCEYNDEDEINN